LVYDQRNVDLLGTIKERLNRDSRYLEIQFRSGREPRWTFLKAQADEAGIAWQLAQARLDIATQQQALCALLGRDASGSTVVIAGGDLESPAPPAEVVSLYPVLERDHPDLLSAAAAVEGDAAALSRSRATWMPSVRASAGYAWSDGSVWPPDRSGWNAGLTATLPLFSGGGDVAAINQARHAWIGSRDTLDDTRAAARSDLFAAWASFVSGHEHQPVFQLDADAATERFRTVQGLYEAGQASYLDFEQAEGSLTQAQQRLLSGRLDLAQAVTQFAQALGRTLEDEDQGEQTP
jgi:outer membrane protein TolC